MDPVTHRFTDMASLVDETHAMLDRWHEEGRLSAVLEEDAFYQLRLSVHEWMANLVQYAEFDDRSPSIELVLEPRGERLFCTIADNSNGFDFAHEVLKRQELLSRLPERGMGLLMLDACTDDLQYGVGEGDLNRLSFFVSSSDDPWLNIPF